MRNVRLLFFIGLLGIGCGRTDLIDSLPDCHDQTTNSQATSYMSCGEVQDGVVTAVCRWWPVGQSISWDTGTALIDCRTPSVQCPPLGSPPPAPGQPYCTPITVICLSSC